MNTGRQKSNISEYKKNPKFYPKKRYKIQKSVFTCSYAKKKILNGSQFLDYAGECTQ